SMDAAGQRAIARRIEANPEEFVAQEQVALSTVPVRTGCGLTPRHAVLRVFAAWDGESYTILPGGLTRVSTEASSLVVSMQMGGGSKDTWVLGDASKLSSPPRVVSTPLEAPRGPGELPSRVADNLFWLGRYAERVEAGVRMVRALLPGLSGEEDFGRTASLEVAIQLLSALGHLPKETLNGSLSHRRWQLQRVLSQMTYDPARNSGIG